MRRLSRKKSKRMSLRKKHTVVKEASEAKRKLRKEARRMARQGIKRPEPKDPGIPNTCPNKKQLLEDLEEQRKIESEHRREVQQRAREKRNNQEFEKLSSVASKPTSDSSIEALIASSDVILEVLDARDPHPSLTLPGLIDSKPHIFVLNKADLVPESVASSWREKLSLVAQTFIFQSPASESMKQALVEYLKSFKKVGIVGFPGVGKSSFVNAFKGFRLTNIGKLPGMTKKNEEFQVDSWTFIDSPGMENDEKSPSGALRTVKNIENLSDPYTPIMGILEKVPKEKLLVLYGIPDFANIQEFLTHVAKKLGKVAKGGVPNFDSAGKIVLHDWFTHKIPFYVLSSS